MYNEMEEAEHEPNPLRGQMLGCMKGVGVIQALVGLYFIGLGIYLLRAFFIVLGIVLFAIAFFARDFGFRNPPQMRAWYTEISILPRSALFFSLLTCCST